MVPSFLISKSAERGILLSLLIPVLAMNMWCGFRILELVSQQAVIKDDYAEVNSIRNGLLSVDVWKRHIQHITLQRFEKLRLTRQQEITIRDAIETSLNALITETEKMMQRPQKTLKGKVRKVAFNVLIDTKQLKEHTPQYASAIFQEVRKPENLSRLKNIALTQIKTTTRAEAEGVSRIKMLMTKYRATDTDNFNSRLRTLINDFDATVRTYTTLMIGSLFLFLATWLVVRGKPDLHAPLFLLSVALAFTLLMSGLSLPMIDIDARIKNFDFLLLGENLKFTDQVLFYRSKSIMQMVEILVIAGKGETVFVGFLIFLFSVLFPIGKLSAAVVCLFGSPRFRENKVVQFLAYQSGKWSMADVMVVAIFMAYIGFNGVLNGQIKSLNFRSESVAVIATNETALQPGFLLFLSFVLFGLVLSAILKKIAPQPIRSLKKAPYTKAMLSPHTPQNIWKATHPFPFDKCKGTPLNN